MRPPGRYGLGNKGECTRMTGILFSSFVFLCAACLIVPLAGRLRLGSVLGYLVAGVLIGPFGAGLIENPEEVLHFAEFGVVMMLFIIGLELEPEKLWRMRGLIFGLGGLQVLVTTLLIALLGIALGYPAAASLACGMALSLSSTALVLQMLKEKNLMDTAAGESSFAVLLMQDVAVIPILVVLPLLAAEGAQVQRHDLLATMPAWLRAEIVLGVIMAIIAAGRYFSRQVFDYVARTNLREVFTATSLALITGITLLMQAIGLSPALGAFVAGVVLASSEYKHTLEADIDPFKSLLLGLFFISVGMGMDFSLLASQPFSILGAVAALVAVKMAVLFLLGRNFGLMPSQNVIFTFIMAQGGEFAFVLLQYATFAQVLPAGQAAFLTLTVALSMASTPFLMMAASRWVMPRFMSQLPPPEADVIEERHPVIIAGYGRFGQIIGRFLRGQGVEVTVLEIDPGQIDLIRRFGGKGYFGDATRLDLLRSAGAGSASLLVVAVDNADKALEIVRMARQNFPQLTVFARARNRRHAYELDKAGAHLFLRETFDSSLRMAQEAMVHLGYRRADMEYKAAQFKAHDEDTLHRSFAFFEQEPELISFSTQARKELERILRSDIGETGEEPQNVPS